MNNSIDGEKYKEDVLAREEPRINAFVNDVIESLKSGVFKISKYYYPLSEEKMKILHSQLTNREIYEKIFVKITWNTWRRHAIGLNCILIPFDNNMSSMLHEINITNTITQSNFDYDKYLERTSLGFMKRNKKVEYLYNFLNSKVNEKGITKEILKYLFCFKKNERSGELKYRNKS